jgi:hypothetical protein
MTVFFGEIEKILELKGISYPVIFEILTQHRDPYCDLKKQLFSVFRCDSLIPF